MPVPSAPPIVGRDDLLETVLTNARGRTALQILVGAPGSGKTTLLDEIQRRLAGRAAVLPIATRAYRTDHLPFGAAEDLVAGLLAAISRPLTPDEVDTVGAWFPHLAGGGTRQHAPSPHALVACLSAWTAEAAPTGHVVYLVDDGQWGDTGAARVVGEWLATCPQAAVVVATIDPDSPFPRRLCEHVQRCALVHDIPPLDDASALVIATAHGADPAAARERVTRAAGNPSQLGDALRGWERDLTAAEARLLRILALTGAPMALDTASAYAEASGLDLERATTRLTARNRIQTPTLGGRAHLAVYGEALRDTILSGIPDEQRRALHQLALDLSKATDAGPAAAYPHHVALDQPIAALSSALDAAADAERLGAFADAAMWVGRAAQWCSDDERSPLLARQAHLAWQAGQTTHAGELFVQLSDVDPRNRALATQAWILAGRFDAALDASRETLTDLGVSPARSSWRVAMGIAWRLLRALVTGPTVRRRPVAEDTADADFLWHVGIGLAFVRSTYGLDCVLRANDRYARAGDAAGVARCAAFLGGSVFFHIPPLRNRGRRWLDYAAAVAEDTEDRALVASIGLWQGFHAIGFGEYARAHALLDNTLEVIAANPAGLHWERAIAAGLMAWLIQTDGDYVAQQAFSGRHLADAVQRGDRYATLLFNQYLAYAALANDRPARTMAFAKELAQVWPAEGYSVLAFYGMYLEVMVHLYEGRPDHALTRWKADQVAFRKAGLHMIPASRIDNNTLEARIVLNGAGDRGRLVPLARALSNEARPDALGYAAWLAAATGQGQRESLPDALTERGMTTLGLCAAWQVASDDARPDIARQLDRRGVTAPDRWVPAMLPLRGPSAKHGGASVEHR